MNSEGAFNDTLTPKVTAAPVVPTLPRTNEGADEAAVRNDMTLPAIVKRTTPP